MWAAPRSDISELHKAHTHTIGLQVLGMATLLLPAQKFFVYINGTRAASQQEEWLFLRVEGL